ncbi:MAG: sulfatase-like hydrolase/transferase, partial [Lentisphaerae bacterium]|nr:sulfatase-like hydrolase/transferase [Lentisphaerota bacterium]
FVYCSFYQELQMNQSDNRPKPNILLITDDEHRCDFYGGDLVNQLATPALDRLKQKGVTFPNAITNCPVCMPTRFTWLSGLYGSQSPAGPRNAKDWPLGHPTVTQALQRAGYQTAIIGKLHAYHGGSSKTYAQMKDETHARGFDYVFMSSGGSDSPNYKEYLKGKGRGKDVDEIANYIQKKSKMTADVKQGGEAPSSVPDEDRYDEFLCREAIRWLDTYDSKQPFFLHASFCKPHFPLDPPEPYFSKYRPEDMPPPVGIDDPERIKYWQQRRAVYCGLVEYTDACIGKLLEFIESRGLMENTIIIFSSDHGDMMGDRDMYFKMKPFDASVRTPTIVYDPNSRLPGGTVLKDMVEAVDIPATILEAGSDEHLQEAMPCSPGRSFLKYARGEKDAHRQWAYSEHGILCEQGASTWRLIRTPEWKYIYSPNGDMLFNLVDDPLEAENLAHDTAQLPRLHQMRGLMIQRMGSLPVPPASLICDTDPDEPKALNSRFYKGILNEDDGKDRASGL